MMKNLGKMMQQAQQMQTKMQEMQAEMEQATVEGKAGAGLVTVTMNGKHEIKALKIDPTLVTPDDVEVLEDLIMAASNDAKAKVDVMMQEKMKELTGGMQLPPGMSLPF